MNQQKIKQNFWIRNAIRVLIVLLICVSTGFSDKKEKSKDESKTVVKNFKQFSDQFLNPSNSYAPAPLYVWNSKVTKEDLKWQLADLKDKGFGGVFVHPRPGMVNEYLSKDWFELFQYTMKRCKELGMEVWIYDENTYPSGFAGGYVPEQMPSSYNQGQGLKGKPTDQLPKDILAYELVLVKEGDKWNDITQSVDRYKGKPGKYYLFEKTYYKNSPWFGGFTYVDLLVPGVTEKFLDITMEQGYTKYFPENIGKEIKGIFSDEPGIYAPDFQSIRWTPDLFDIFQKQWGYDLKTHLPLLVEETGNWKEVRNNYYKTLLQLFIDRWSKPISAYCESHGISWTGHYWDHKWPDPDQCPDNMAMYAWHQLPAIDMLYNDFSDTRYNELNANDWPQAQFGNVQAVKELSSVANQLGKSRSLSETYGGVGWDFTFNDMKRLGDWEFALGVNFMCQHLVDMSIAGARKYDYPPTYSYHEPWWGDYKYLNDYFGRLSFALSSGKQVNHVLVLEPTSTAWMYATRGKVLNRIKEIGKSFHLFTVKLEKQQVEYDLGSENIIKDYGKVSEGKFRVGERAYDIVVIPPDMENLDSSTFLLIKSFIQEGGKILDFGSLNCFDGKEQAKLIQELKSNPNWFSQTNSETGIIQKELFFDDWKVVKHDSAQGKLFHQRRILPDGQLLFLVNSDKVENASGEFELIGKDVVEFKPATGELVQYPMKTSDAGSLKIKVDLLPSESLLLYVLNKKREVTAISEQIGQFSSVPCNSSLKIQSSEKNVLSIDFCDLKLKDSVFHDLHVLDAAKRVFKAHGFKAGNPWNTMVQFRSETLKRDTFPVGTGFSVVYNFNIDKAIDFSTFEAVVEGRDPEPIVEVNGKKLVAVPGKWWLDRSFRVYQIGKFLKEGQNTLEIKTNPMNVFAEVEPIYILGDFKLKSAEKGWSIGSPVALKLGSWKEQGMPFYAKSVDYSQDYKIVGPGKYQVQFKKWEGTVAEVLVNGQKAGIIFCQPFTLDISDLLKTGSNTVTVKIIGSNKNLFGPFHGNLPIGLASVQQWSNITNYPSGAKYQQVNYGLMENFELQKQIINK